jgi:hypothetical protein
LIGKCNLVVYFLMTDFDSPASGDKPPTYDGNINKCVRMERSDILTPSSALRMSLNSILRDIIQAGTVIPGLIINADFP